MLTKITSDYKCDGCGAEKTLTRKKTAQRTLFRHDTGLPGWTRDYSSHSPRRSGRDLCAGCTKAVNAAKRAALAARRKTRK